MGDLIIRLFKGRESFSQPRAVDVGLSVMWADSNVGANTPEKYGDYFAWGETSPYKRSLKLSIWNKGKSAGYNWPSYKWCKNSYDTQTKYCTKSEYGIVDHKTKLDFADDSGLLFAGSCGYFWTSSLDMDDPLWARGVTFGSDSVDRYGSGNRCYGRSIRPVSE